MCPVRNSQRLIKAIVRMVGQGQREEDDTSRMLRDGAVEHADFVEGRTAFLAKRPPRFA